MHLSVCLIGKQKKKEGRWRKGREEEGERKGRKRWMKGMKEWKEERRKKGMMKGTIFIFAHFIKFINNKRKQIIRDRIEVIREKKKFCD